ncbi:hypothetical protein JHK82_015967 [Glycine max]|uniref:Uncharacterized protein n=1 Tax=Glycine max TaxID=3847 RepID=A0A0R0JK71_SOYBN|nr:hypothetical protein JHK87_015911 [Glycine soja]KAG5032381.1 hypothetical protein JHK85_016363 [Glycine max]KAG5046585.1 hypothetical protein JHK86_015991 [Glycine max]KAG5149086.1 hypothetical protein JHK82_015967 [Glycine max]KAH1126989.1 hypothetical protein GYH30_015819 [Glycine max]
MVQLHILCRVFFSFFLCCIVVTKGIEEQSMECQFCNEDSCNRIQDNSAWSSRLFFKQATSWRQRSPKDIIISVASEMSQEFERNSQLPVQMYSISIHSHH